MKKYVLDFQDIEKEDLSLVGGKGVNLGEMAKIPRVRVPIGFCVTTEAYKKMLEQYPEINELLEHLTPLTAEDIEQIRELSQAIRETIEKTVIPPDVLEDILRLFLNFGENFFYAVRSSATAEDLPAASFAGQHDTYLNVHGQRAILHHIRKCWASLFSERAIVYRIQNGFDHRKVYLSVVIQQMVYPEASGILFTADPITSNRHVLSIDASFGLGEALVAGIVTADNYKVREGKILEKTLAEKKVAIVPLNNGGIDKREIATSQQKNQTLTDEQILHLENLARKIEGHFRSPQDIEWCLADGVFYFVQSRPITTLYPLPDKMDGNLRVYLSFAHQQMMTDPIRPLGISFIELLHAHNLNRAGGRIYIDVTHDLASPLSRRALLGSFRKNDPLTHNALVAFRERKIPLPKGKRMFSMGGGRFSWGLPAELIKLYRNNDMLLAQQLIAENEASLKRLESEIQKFSGDELFAFIEQDQTELLKLLSNKKSMAAIFLGLYAASWLNDKMDKWLGEKNAADVLSQSVPNNVTSEMGYALLDVSDVVRQSPEAVAYLETAEDEKFLEALEGYEGGKATSKSIRNFLKKYGVRCSGEIDITNPRWIEQPSALVPMILSNIKNFEPNARRTKFEKGRKEAKEKEQELLRRLERLPQGKKKANATKKQIDRLRNFIGYREYPKFAMIQRYFLYKQALMKEAAILAEKGILQKKEDVFFLNFDEFRKAVRTEKVNLRLIEDRKADHIHFEKLDPPRVMTSEGEIISGRPIAENLPADALPGIAVSSGIAEGRARVILKMEDAVLEKDDILVTVFTDPSWTPLFVAINGLVTEVGGLMTHGAVIAREYGLPAVVGVENATKHIKDGQRIRINGTEGYVEILEEETQKGPI
ncbi:phosphoenolpyruvate synthase [Planomicrobium sp. CPCC 101110]|uniref:phosphoenolpyruvate synthase n=1 Tax=Planomicrobium sp. CPCC 101110 TaxID=2599619 RepID=UPI0011B7DFFE|nr:phosphoenolpyruvate synthase [Planomicrobium sp. CPCC 101110]TWT25132.1 phosphoenolpyruvate synthase [Planomicrobium sp. CPCC 101110]